MEDELEQSQTDFSEAIPEPDEVLITGTTQEERYFNLLVAALHACIQYKPMFGKGRKGGGLTLEDFQQMYGSDPFYNWIGLDSPLMYAAHKAAGGMTSIYRQLGIGGEWIFRNLLKDSLNLSSEQAIWSYQVPSTPNKTRTLTLDGRIQFDHVKDSIARTQIEQWVSDAANKLLLPAHMKNQIKGVVFVNIVPHGV